ncbi:MAG: glycosyltransferase family 2 protein [Candidatus Bathyarchaeota archaeon]|nr:glycosyltransferase family 2 protein [Candidatus Bathyarchaeota archaeon]
MTESPNNLPLVSIVTPSYNHARFIEDTILSVMNQKYKNIEHLIFDGGSSDGTIEILKKYQSLYNLKWVSEKDKGQSNALNKGFLATNGEIIGWLNSDDIYFNIDTISYVVEKFNDLPNVDLIYGNSAYVDENNKILKFRYSPKFNYNKLLKNCFILQPSVFFRKEVVKNNILNENMHFAFDYEYWLRLIKNGIYFHHVDAVLSAVREHKDMKSLSQMANMKKETENTQKNYGYKNNLSDKIQYSIDILGYMYIKLLGLREIRHLYNGDYDMAVKLNIDSYPRLIKRQIFYTYNKNVQSSS